MSLPRTLSNPCIQDKVTFLRTGSETNGSFLHLEVELAPGGGNGLHYHADYQEVFEVVEGALGVQYDRDILTLRKGEKATVPRFVHHRFYNPSDTEGVRFRVIVAPACQFEQMIRIAYGLANDGLTNGKGVPDLWSLAIMIQKGGSYFPGVPTALQKAFFTLMAQLARWRGVDKKLAKYYLAD